MSLPTARPPVIVTDGTCDLPQALIDQYAIRVVPLRILFGSETYRSGVEMDLSQFAARLAVQDVHPTSSQPTAHDFQELYAQLGADGTPILSIHLSERLSGTINAARQAARNLPHLEIMIWDSLTISAALGLQVLTAARAASQGYATEQITPLLQQTYDSGNLLFGLDDLSFLMRGGRIGSVTYHVAQALNIRPVISVSKSGPEQGTYISVGRVRSLEKAINVFVKRIVADVGEGAKLRAMIFYGVSPTPELAGDLGHRLQQLFDCVFLETAPSTPVLGVHVGTKAIDIGYAAGDWAV
ncbi:DegV family protein [Aggregatilinea lenta]|uniref:DegV family protein n=1 Tax=Aggregatilinea lenta TaxID=913108 RepID=UPI000E5B62EA|nr:DegV family protein [Aggregatilinea lenta]